MLNVIIWITISKRKKNYKDNREAYMEHIKGRNFCTGELQINKSRQVNAP
jgi:hypothetical protein